MYIHVYKHTSIVSQKFSCTGHLWYIQCTYCSGTSLPRTPLGPREVSIIWRSPYFRGCLVLQRTLYYIGTSSTCSIPIIEVSLFQRFHCIPTGCTYACIYLHLYLMIIFSLHMHLHAYLIMIRKSTLYIRVHVCTCT